MKNLTLLELNEINFDYVQWYIDNGYSLPGFEWLMSQNPAESFAEKNYEELEPWIQWPSVHTGKTYAQHKVFRLGDIVKAQHRQIFEEIEALGFRVGAISPMNAANRLCAPTYFIPDPWTKTETSGSWLVKRLSEAVSQTVNDNSGGRISSKSSIALALGFLFLVPLKQKTTLFKLLLKSEGKPWNKALFLDTFLYGVHKTLSRQTKTQFSTLFLNAGAHIQHHYLLNSPAVDKIESNPGWYVPASEDPTLEMIRCYDEIIQDLKKSQDCEFIVATGLSQKPYSRIKFYYRLRDHHKFLKQIGLTFNQVIPRMTRDFLIKFNTEVQAANAATSLAQIFVDSKEPLFGQIHNRGTELFVVLDYPHEINENTIITINGTKLALEKLVHFVAIKNGEHQTKGFVYSTLKQGTSQPEHVANLYGMIAKYFGGETTAEDLRSRNPPKKQSRF